MSIFYKVYTLSRKYKVTDGQSIFYINPRVADVKRLVLYHYYITQCFWKLNSTQNLTKKVDQASNVGHADPNITEFFSTV